MTGADGRAPYQSLAAHCALMGALLFNAGLCFLNTMGLPVSGGTVAGAEACIVMLALAFALDHRAGPWLVLAVLAAYAILLLVLRGSTDPKLIRDLLIPVAFYNLGLRAPDIRDADRAALAAGLVVVAMGLFEYAALPVYEQVFNIVRYYIARGTMTAAEMNGLTGSLFASGVRPDARTILPFLGPHRVSSVFLEPVSAGNFGAILFAWGLYRPEMRGRAWLFACAAAAIILADARFGAVVCVAIAAALVGAHRLPRLLWFGLPCAILLALAICGFESTASDRTNNFVGRLLVAAEIITALPVEGVFGASNEKVFVADAGYAYVLLQLGLVGGLAAWLLFVLMPAGSADAWRLRCAVATYLCLLLVISDSPFSIKTAALLWFLLGAADGARTGPALAGNRARSDPGAGYPADLHAPAHATAPAGIPRIAR